MRDPISHLIRLVIATLGTVTPPAPGVLATAIVTLGSWVALHLALPDMDARLRFSLAFGLGLAAFFARRLWVVRWQRPGLLDDRLTQIVFIAPLSVLCIALARAADPQLCQRAVTVFFVLIAGLHGTALLADQKLLKRYWQGIEPAMRTALSAGTMLLSLSFAILNEALSRHIAPMDWLIFWAMLPVTMHYAFVLMVHVVMLTGEAEG